MKLLVKIGGTLLENEASRQAIAAQLVEMARGHAVVAVHGGGKQLTRFLEERGVKSSFVNGLRVSNDSVIDAITKVIAGSVNKQLVSALIHAGQPAIGISGADGPLTLATQLNPALGWVGKPVQTDGKLLHALVTAGYLPVVACIAGDREGRIYNVNADQMAVSCAIGWRADRLIFLTDVEGVKDANGRLIPRLTRQDIAALIRSGVAHGGMHAKLDAAVCALDGGLTEVAIASGHAPDICVRLLRGDAAGTRLTAETLVAEASRT